MLIAVLLAADSDTFSGAGTSGVAAALESKEKSAPDTSKKILSRPRTIRRAESVLTPEGNSTLAYPSFVVVAKGVL